MDMRTDMRKHRKRLLLAALLLLCCLVVSGCLGQRERPRDLLIRSYPSPDGTHTMNVYRNDDGATVDWATTVSVVEIATGREWNIYFHYHEYEPDSIAWLDNEHVQINDITLNIHTEYYESFDYR